MPPCCNVVLRWRLAAQALTSDQKQAMNRTHLSLIIAGFLTVPTPLMAGDTSPDKLGYPTQVALSQVDNRWIYRHFPTGLRLYVYDLDEPGKSNCTLSCSAAWPPVEAPADAVAVGHWTPIARPDSSRRQWAYKGRPVYVRYHDSIEKPSGDGRDGVWHFLEP